MQNFEVKNEHIRQRFAELKQTCPEAFARRLNLSWSNWGFGLEPLADSCARLARWEIPFIELHGNHYGPDLGYRPAEVRTVLDAYGLKASGVCGMFSADNDLASNRPVQRQAAIDYIRREVEFTAEVGGSYLLVVPGAVGRPVPYDSSEWERSTETLRLVGDFFVQYGIKAAIEPIRSVEVSFVHTVAEAKAYIEAVGHPGIRHMNGDVYHMQSGETHIGEAILEAGEQLVNLHLADSNRCALGEGFLDLDTILRALYSIGYAAPERYVTPEPLGPGANPYPAMNAKPDPEALERLVGQTVRCFREREQAVRDEPC